MHLRGHHFLCLLTYRGAGYTQPFVDNMTAIANAISLGVPVLLTSGPDDICGGFTGACRVACDHDCSARDTLVMDFMAAKAVEDVLNRSLETAAELTRPDIGALREAFKQKTIRAACTDCPWQTFCDDIADENFVGTLL